MNHEKSKMLFQEALTNLVGGVNSPVRAFKNVGGTPLFIKKAKGPYIWDEDDNKYIDYVGSFGPAILGHAHPKIVSAIKNAAENGASFGAPCEMEVRLAEMVKSIFPSIELIRFTNSGTESVMGAIRAARGFTKKDKIIKFDGCYHGHADYMLVKAGSGALTFGSPDSAGVPNDFAKDTLVARYNDLDSVEDLLKKNQKEVAAIIVEPVAGNMGCVPPKAGFLKGLKDLCSRYDTLLIFDEVMTGFRVSFGGAQERFGVKPDLTCLGKVVGGGLPVGAYGGRKDVMEMVAPMGPVYQAGTLSGNPLAMAAGIKTLELLAVPGVYDNLNQKSNRLVLGLEKVLKSKKIKSTVTQVGSMWSVFFGVDGVSNLDDVMKSDKESFVKYFYHMLNNGVYLAPSPYESGFVSLAHTDEEIDRTIEVLQKYER